MVSRLVLVGVVGALGISVPTWPEIQEWTRAAHSWTACQLAAWDTSTRSEADSIAVASMPVSMPLGSKPGAGSESQRAARPSPAFEPIVVDEQASGFADELNRMAEGLDAPPIASIAGRRPNVEGRNAPEHTRRHDHPWPALVADALELRLIAELLQATSTGGGEALSPPPQRMQGRARAAIAPVACVFSRSLPDQKVAPTVRSTISALELPSGKSTTRTVAIERPSVAMPGTGHDLDCFAEAGDQPAPGVAGLTASRPVFDPIEPGPNLAAGLADQLNRECDGLTVISRAPVVDDRSERLSSKRQRTIPSPAPPSVQGSQSGRAPHVAQALRLTGEAVQAWMNVLRGPTIVQMSAR